MPYRLPLPARLMPCMPAAPDRPARISRGASGNALQGFLPHAGRGVRKPAGFEPFLQLPNPSGRLALPAQGHCRPGALPVCRRRLRHGQNHAEHDAGAAAEKKRHPSCTDNRSPLRILRHPAPDSSASRYCHPRPWGRRAASDGNLRPSGLPGIPAGHSRYHR